MYSYVPREEMQSVLDIADFPERDRAEIAYEYFVNRKQEAMYIEENGILLGVVSIGDLERYYGGINDKLTINSHFLCTDKIDEEKASNFFVKFETFFEFPVVNAEGQLEGVIKRNLIYKIRQDQIASLVVSKYLKKQWHRRELNRFITNTKAKVVLYYIEESVLLREIADRRKAVSGGENVRSYWKGLSESQWSYFLGEPDIAATFKKEFGNFHTEMVKGISELVDMGGEFYHCAGGSRITTDNPENPSRRIIFYGPCTVAGIACRDNHTIESYLQRIMNLRTDLRIQVINRGLFNSMNFFSRMITDELSEKDVVAIYVVKKWLTEEILHKCVYAGNLTDTFLSVEGLESNVLDIPEHCNFRVNECLAKRIFQDFAEHKLLDAADCPGEAGRIQDYYIGSEIMSEVLLYMENNSLINKAVAGIKGAMTLLADPFTDRHRQAVETALQKVDILYLFLSEDSNLKCTLEERMQKVKEALRDLEKHIVVVPAGKYLYTKKISRGIRKQRFCDNDMEYDCDIFGEIFGRFMGIKYRFVLSEMNNPVERKYMETCKSILPRFGMTVEEL